MKKKKFMSLLLITILIFTMSFHAVYAEEADRIYSIDEPYDFPVSPYDEEWADFETKAEALACCQIPENILKEMTTEALLETVLNYPFLIDYIAHDNYYAAAEKFMVTFNGFEELLSRSDLTEVLLTSYDASTLQNSTILTPALEDYLGYQDIESYLKDYWETSHLEFLIAYDQVVNDDYTQAEAVMFDALILEKNQERENSDLYSANSNTYNEFMADLNPAYAVN